MDVKPGDKRAEAEQILKAMENVANEPAEDAKKGIIRLSTGVVLQVTGGLSPSILTDIDAKFPEPPVPKVYDADRDREVENPASPTYLAARQKVNTDKGLAVIDALVVLCTKAVELPEGFPDENDADWLDKMGILGYNPTSKNQRYLLWVKNMAAPNEQDWQKIATATMRRMGVRESDVQASLDKFPGDEERNTDPTAQNKRGSKDRDTGRTPPAGVGA